MIFNCTPLGSNLKKSFEKKIPINNDLIHEISNKSFVFDIIYSPIQTILLKECKLYGLEGINGLRMNTLQAEKALNIVFNKSK